MNIEGKPPSHGNMTRGAFYNLGFLYDWLAAGAL